MRFVEYSGFRVPPASWPRLPLRPIEVTHTMVLNLVEKASHDASNIRFLRAAEAVRMRPELFLGGIDAKALLRLVFEVVDNATQEALAGHGSAIAVTIHADGSASVVDEGRGIPVGLPRPFPGATLLEVVLTKLHA